MKKFLFPLIVVILVAIISLGAFLWWRNNSQPVSTDAATKDFLILKGRSASQIAQKLYQEGLIKNPLAFKIYVQVSGRSKELQAGEFRLSPSYSLIKVVDVLTSEPLELWVTIPEGLRREEIVEKFVSGLETEVRRAQMFREEFLSATEGKEGFLFPDTYLFPKDATVESVASTMRNTFDKKIEEFQSAISDSKLSLPEIVTLASIIERETKTDAERPIVAGILLKRLEIGMGLQADAAVQYAVGNVKCQMSNVKCDNWWPILTKEDLAIDSPYNTYKYRGLPPAPIANPGLSSLKAAIFPESSEYLYYIHDPEGNIHYAATLAEHNENVRKFLNK